MPKVKSDYSKTIMYVIRCKDINIIKKYYGHTTAFSTRKSAHKISCNKETSPDYNDDKYLFIRENGGWSNWEMIEIELYPCNNLIEARIREQFHIDNDTNSLNMDKAHRTNEERLNYMKDWWEINKEKLNKDKKDKYATNEEFKNKAIERAKLRREAIKADPEKAEQMRKYKREWAKKKHDEIHAV